MSDGDRTNTFRISMQYQANKQWEKKKIRELLVDLIPDSLNKHPKNCRPDSTENY